MPRPTGVLLLALVLAGCGANSTKNSPPLPPTVPAPATLLADGTVPWVDEPTIDAEYTEPPKQRRADANAKPCKAEQLKGELDKWIGPSKYVEPGARPSREPASLIGYVQVTNTSKDSCRLAGEVDTRMLSGGKEVPIGYSHGISDEAKALVTVVPPGERAELRLDWTGPFCVPSDGQRELLIHLPGGGGEVRAPIKSFDAPPCSQNPEDREYKSTLSSSAFDEPAITSDSAPRSPFAALKATIEPVASVKPGETLKYFVRLENPTDKPISLAHCPGYAQTRFARGDANSRAINDRTVYRVNCRPVKEIPAHGTIRFEFGLVMPTDLAGRELSVDWQLRAPSLSNEVRGEFRIKAS